MISNLIIRLFTLFLLIFIGACTKDDFTRTTITTTEEVTPVKIDEIVGCAQVSPPPLDILILYDNSTSLYYFKRNVKAAVRELVGKLSTFKDFNICLAPLIPTPNDQYKCTSYVSSMGNTSTGLVATGVNDISVDGITTNVYTEKGFERAFEFLNRNKQSSNLGDKVFRPGAYTVAITISNGDDTDIVRDSWGNIIEGGKINFWSDKLLSFKTEMNLKRLRYISVVNWDNTETCGGTTRYPGTRYKLMSKVIYSAQGLNDDSRADKDSYNLCNVELVKIFNQIAQSINNYKVGHRYAVWPLGSMSGKDPNKLKVWKGSNGNKVSLTKGDTNNGFTYDPSLAVKNIREFPPVSTLSPSENFAGPFLNLYGSGKVTYPECLYVQKEDFTKYYGYIVMNDEPDITQLSLSINGVNIPKDTTNGWDYLGFKQSIFVLVKSPQDLTPGPIPSENPQKYYRSGYVLKLYGNAVYIDGAKIELSYKKAKQI